MKKRIALIIVFLFIFNVGHLFSQTPISLDRAFQQTLDSIYTSVNTGSRIFISDIQSNSQSLTEYTINKLLSKIVNNRRKGNLFVVERNAQNIALMNNEMNYQLSGEVSDETALSLGRKLGAEIIVTGNIKPHADNFLLHIRVIHIETGEILVVTNEVIKSNRELRQFVSVNRNTNQTRNNTQVKNNTRTVSWHDTEWMNNWLYLGGRLGFTPNIYNLNSNIDMNAEAFASFDLAFQIGLHLTKHFFLQTELIYSSDEVVVIKPEKISLQSSSLTIPVIAKFGFSHNLFHYAFLGGLAFPIGLGNLEVEKNGVKQEYEYSIPIGLLLGVNLGVKLGPGIVFTDLRLLQDLGYINANGADQYSRTKICITLGYDFALWGK